MYSFHDVRRAWGPKFINLDPLYNILMNSCCHTTYKVIILFVNRVLTPESWQCFTEDSRHTTCRAWRECRLRLQRNSPLALWGGNFPLILNALYKLWYRGRRSIRGLATERDETIITSGYCEMFRENVNQTELVQDRIQGVEFTLTIITNRKYFIWAPYV
jgi:hypothetical protein